MSIWLAATGLEEEQLRHSVRSVYQTAQYSPEAGRCFLILRRKDMAVGAEGQTRIQMPETAGNRLWIMASRDELGGGKMSQTLQCDSDTGGAGQPSDIAR